MKYKSSNTRIQQHKINQDKDNPGLVDSYNIRPGNGASLFSKEKIKK